MRLALAFLLFSLATMTAADDWKTWFTRGNEAFHTGRYEEAVDAFRVAADLNPEEFLPPLYLGMTWAGARVPEMVLPQNPDSARNAEAAFTRALQLHPNDVLVLKFLASLSYRQLGGNAFDSHLFDEAVSWYHKLIAADPFNQEAYYTLGEMAWSKEFAAFAEPRAKLMMTGDSGPIKDPKVREELKTHLPELEEGISNLEKALEIDPEYDLAMNLMQLLIRDRALLRDTVDEYQRDIKTADQWALAAREAKGRNNTEPVRSASAKFVSIPTLPDDPPSKTGMVLRLVVMPPSPMRVAAKRQEANLTHKVDPVYPPPAQGARIQRIVRLRVTINEEGSVTNSKVISGDPLLVDAAREAVGQWKYKPTPVDGIAVEVVTTVDVRFNLDGPA